MSTEKRKIASKLPAAFLSALLAAAPGTYAQSLDQHAADVVAGIKSRDAGKTLSSLADAGGRMVELHAEAKRLGKIPLGVGDELLKGLNVLAMEPSELGWLEEWLQKDTARLKAIKPRVPAFGNPLDGVAESRLRNVDPYIRGRALDDVRLQGRNLRIAYEEKLADFKAKREAANRYYGEAKASKQRGDEVINELNKIDKRLSGTVYKLTVTLVEMEVFINKELADRVIAADNLVERYDRVIPVMEKTLEHHKIFSEWTNYYRMQDWVRVNLPQDRAQPGQIAPSKDFPKAGALINRADRQAEELSRQETPSRNQSITRQLETTLIQNTRATQEQAAQLIRQAERADAKAGALRDFTALVTLAGATNGAASQSSQNPPPLISNDPNIKWEFLGTELAEPVDHDPRPDH